MPKMKKSLLATSIAAAMLASLSLSATAAEINWTGANGDQWIDGTNWEGGVEPGVNDDAIIDVDNPVVLSSVPTTTIQSLTIGNAGNGTLSVANGGVQANNAVIGAQAGSNGEVTLDAESGVTTWDVTDSVVVGREGTGVLTINNGATVVSGGDSSVGDAAGSTGTVVVDGVAADGTASTWTNAGVLTIGRAGTGTLTISNGAAVDVNGIVVGGAFDAGEPVAGAGDGTLTLLSGGSLLGNTAIIGATAGSTGKATINGENAVMELASNLIVGLEGTGTFTIQEGEVSSSIGSIGALAGGVGTLTVDGQNSSWTATELHVGGFADAGLGSDGGTGTLTIKNGGTVLSSTGSVVGEVAGSTGTVIVKDQGSTWANTGLIAIGVGGFGTLAIENGGVVTNTADGFVGFLAGSTGTVTVDGVATDGTASTWNNTGTLTIGAAGIGSLAITNGASVNVDSSIAVGGSLIPEQSAAGDGTLTLRSGGSLQSSASALIGATAGSTGHVTIDGKNSLMEATSGLIVGAEGTGTLTIREGQIRSGSGAIGAVAGGVGTVTVDGQNSLWTNSELHVGGVAGTLIGSEGGNGTLTVQNGAHVFTDGGDSFIGEVAGSIGTATVTGQGSLWSTTTDLSVGFASTGTLTIANGGRVQAGGAAIIANEEGAIGVLNIGAAAGEAAASAGMLDSPTLSFGAGTGTLNFNHTDTAYDFNAAIAGAGTVNVLAGTTRLTADSSAFGGGTTVQGGELRVDGTLGGATSIAAGARLSGNGRVQNLAVSGTIAPGASVGTLTVNGNYVQNGGSVYEAEIDAAGQADRIAVNGTAQLDGSVALSGRGAIGATYTLLTADGGVSGQYDSLNNATLTPFLDVVLRYDPNAVLLDVTRSDLTFASVGVSRNQRATGAALDHLSLASPLVNELVGLDEHTALGALDQLSGEIHASTRSALVEDSRVVREAIGQRLRAAQGDSDNAAWAQAYGNGGSIDDDGNAAETDTGSGGVLIGADKAFGQARLGVMGGAGRVSVHADERSSKANSDSLYVGAYAGTHWGSWGLRGGLTYGRHDVETERKVAFGGVNEWLRANYDTETTQAFVEAAYRIDTAKSSFEPYLNLAAIKAKNDGYQEYGGIAALRGEEEDTDTGLATLGVRASTRFQWRGMSASLHGGLGWRHAFGDTLPLSHHAFIGGDTFVIAGAQTAEDAAVVSAELDLQLSERTTLGLGYRGQLAEDSRDNSVQAQLQVKF